MFSSLLAWGIGPGIIRPETHDPQYVQGASFSQELVARAQTFFHSLSLRKMGVGPR